MAVMRLVLLACAAQSAAASRLQRPVAEVTGGAVKSPPQGCDIDALNLDLLKVWNTVSTEGKKVRSPDTQPYRFEGAAFCARRHFALLDELSEKIVKSATAKRLAAELQLSGLNSCMQSKSAQWFADVAEPMAGCTPEGSADFANFFPRMVAAASVPASMFQPRLFPQLEVLGRECTMYTDAKLGDLTPYQHEICKALVRSLFVHPAVQGKHNATTPTAGASLLPYTAERLTELAAAVAAAVAGKGPAPPRQGRAPRQPSMMTRPLMWPAAAAAPPAKRQRRRPETTAAKGAPLQLAPTPIQVSQPAPVSPVASAPVKVVESSSQFFDLPDWWQFTALGDEDVDDLRWTEDLLNEVLKDDDAMDASKARDAKPAKRTRKRKAAAKAAPQAVSSMGIV